MINQPDGSHDSDDAPSDPHEMLHALFADPTAIDDPRLAQMAAELGLPNDPASLRAMVMQAQQLLSPSGSGPVNWELACDLARKTVSAAGDASVPATVAHHTQQALRTADLWLDAVCDLPVATTQVLALSRAEWIERTMPVWQRAVGPVAENVGRAMAQSLVQQAPEEIRDQVNQALPMLQTVGGNVFGAQLGHAIGALAGDVHGGADTGLPLLPAGTVALVPANVQAFGAGLGVETSAVLAYLALREVAFGRLLAGAPWLRLHVLDAVAAYAREIHIDAQAVEQAVASVDPRDPESAQHVLSLNLFEPQQSPAQQAALERLELALALVEGWIDTVVSAAATPRLPEAAALHEAMRRRRGSGGPAEQTFAALVGLELRPRRLRDAAGVWQAVTQAKGVAGRDALWRHPDLLPTAEDLADAVGFAQRTRADAPADDMDVELAALLDSGPETNPPGAAD